MSDPDVEMFNRNLMKSLVADNDKQRAEIERLRHNEAFHVERAAAQDAEIERLTDALRRIVRWADAYPTDIFHEPSKEECRRAHELLTANEMTLDAFSASMGRHCMNGVGKIARAALEGKPIDYSKAGLRPGVEY